MCWKLNAKETQYSGNDKPSMLENGITKTNSAKSSHSSISDSERPLAKVEGPCPVAGRTYA